MKRIRDLGIVVGKLPTGKRNLLSDVPSVTVGHFTLSQNDIQTGITAVCPHEGNVFLQKKTAGCEVINGYGKTQGLMQVQELGTLESPILLTNTLAVGTVFTGVVRYLLEQNPGLRSVNPVVAECNDGYLNAIGTLAIKEHHVLECIKNARADFAQGAVGAGRGMSAFGLKGGIGSASRIFTMGERCYCLGALVLSNFGIKEDLLIAGVPLGKRLKKADEEKDQGSLVIILATDLPLCSRQITRLCKRAVIGVARTGSFLGHGSGDVVLGFSTSPQNEERIQDECLDVPFRAVAESVEEAIYDSLLLSETVYGRDQHVRISLSEYIPDILETKHQGVCSKRRKPTALRSNTMATDQRKGGAV